MALVITHKKDASPLTRPDPSLLPFSVSSQHFHRINSYCWRRVKLYAEPERGTSSAN